MHKRAGGRSGFTLIEVLIVIAIIVALGGLVAVAVFQRRDQATEDMARIDMQTMKNAMDMFKLDYDRWPTEEEGVAVLWDKELLDPDADESRWSMYLEEEMPTDRWGSEWGYREESEIREGYYDLWSLGPDKEEGTEDDIQLWESSEEDEFGFEGVAGTGGSGGG
jgi:general secretion pathway protein G